VTLRDRDIVVSHPSEGFTAVYYKPASEPQLILRQRTKCDDHELIANAWQAANTKARELGATGPRESHDPRSLGAGDLVRKVDKACQLAVELNPELSIIGHEPDLFDEVADAFASLQAGILIVEDFGKIDDLVTI